MFVHIIHVSAIFTYFSLDMKIKQFLDLKHHESVSRTQTIQCKHSFHNENIFRCFLFVVVVINLI